MSQSFSFVETDYQVSETAAYLQDHDGDGELAVTLEITVSAPRPGLLRLDGISCGGLTAIEQIDGARLHGHVDDEDEEAYEAAYGDSAFPLALRGEGTSGFNFDDADDSFFRLTGLKIDITRLPTGSFRFAGSFETVDFDSEKMVTVCGKFAIETECRVRPSEG